MHSRSPLIPTRLRGAPHLPGRRLAALAAAALLAVAGTTAAALAQQPRAKSVRAPGCTLKRAKTIKANREVRVFRTVPAVGSGTVYGCRRSATRAYVLGEFGECQNNHEIRRVEVAGRRAALGAFECSLDSGAWDVELVNLATGRLEFRAAPFASPLPDSATFDELRARRRDVRRRARLDGDPQRPRRAARRRGPPPHARIGDGVAPARLRHQHRSRLAAQARPARSSWTKLGVTRTAGF